MSPSSSWKTRTGELGTLLGPMTTAWSPPAGCGVHLVTCSTCVDGYQAQHCIGDAPQDDSGCWPPVVSQAGTPKYPFLGWGFYSPGVACPTGYTAACTAKYGARPDWQIQFNLVAGETAIGCCPEGFQCANNDGNTCYAVVTSTRTTVPTGMCSSGAIVGISQAALPVAMIITATTTVDGDVAVATRTETPEFTLWAPMFQINHRATDLESATSTSPSSSHSGTSTPPNPTANGVFSTFSSSSSSSPPSPAAQGSKLSAGAVAGIGVGAAVGVLLLAAVAGCLLWSRFQRRRGGAEAEADEGWHPPPQSTNPAGGAQHYGISSTEMPTKEALAYVRPELDEAPSAVEMPAGNYPPWQGAPGQGQR